MKSVVYPPDPPLPNANVNLYFVKLHWPPGGSDEVWNGLVFESTPELALKYMRRTLAKHGVVASPMTQYEVRLYVMLGSP